MKVSLNILEGERAFRSVEHLSTHADEQIAKFEELQRNHPDRYQRWGQRLHHGWINMKTRIQGADFQAENLQQYVVNQPCVDFSSPLVILLTSYSSQNLVHRINGVFYALTGDNDANSVGTFGQVSGQAQAIFEATLSRYNGRSSAGKVLQELLNEHERRLAQILEKDEADLQQTSEAFSTLFEASKKQQATFEQRAAAFLQRSDADWSQAYNDYVEQLKTETAVELWEGRATAHEKKSVTYRSLVWKVAAVGGGLGLSWIFGGFALAQQIFPNSPTAQIGSYSAGSILLFTLLVWTIRVLVRSMLSESHLATDASARSAMAHTYLALSKERQAEQEDRAIVLAALFSPVSDGLIKDDGMPILSPAALAAAAVTNTKAMN
jgi:hypothetical protein